MIERHRIWKERNLSCPISFLESSFLDSTLFQTIRCYVPHRKTEIFELSVAV